METGSDGQFFGRLAVWGCGQKKGAPDRRATLHWWRKGGLLFFSFSGRGSGGCPGRGGCTKRLQASGMETFRIGDLNNAQHHQKVRNPENAVMGGGWRPVTYTHLTLPTIFRV